ncbi:MAG: cytochrome P450 [Pseudomonadales bacterium]|nr:cytochrome P450 [Pseudomonadales bacterium]
MFEFSFLDRSKSPDIYQALSSFDLPQIRHFQRTVNKPNLDHIPGGNGIPILGHVYWFLNDLHGFMNRQYAKNGLVFKIKSPLLEGIYLLGPDANRLVFQNEEKMFSNFLAWDNTFKNLFDNNLLERDFSDHKQQRKILQQAFKRPAIEGHIALMNPSIKNGLEQWPSRKTIPAMDYVKKQLLNTGAKVFLGLEIGRKTDKINQAFVDIVAATADPFRRKEIWFSPYAKGVRASKFLSKFIMKNIPERRRSGGRDIFSALCQMRDEDGNYLSDEDIRNHIIFVLFAAHDTTTSALSAILYELASNQAWQDELRREMFNLNKAELEFDDIDQLVKTGWTIKEALRMYPALAIMPRYALQEFEFEGVRIPANTIVLVSSLFTHYMPEYWSNPKTFDPLRFSPERAEDKKDFFQYIPFGGGAHKCLGLHFADIQGKLFLFHLLMNFKVSKSPKMQEYKYNNVPLTFPTDGLPLRFERI